MSKCAGKIIAVIPAKSDSTRLPGKNMSLINGKPLLYYTLGAAKNCSLIHKVYVSTESEEIANYARKEGVSVIMRPLSLCADAALVDVYVHSLNNMDERDVSYVVGLQPDHPDRNVDLEKIIKYTLEKDCDDVISVDSNGVKNGSIRIMKAQALRDKKLSVNISSVMDKATNIHTGIDLSLAALRLYRKEYGLRITIKKKVIASDARTFIIAEGACNHMCDINLAKKMIDEAEAAGADAIKFQTYKAEKLVAKDAQTYWNYGSAKSQYEYYKNLDKFGKNEYQVLFDYAKHRNIVLFSSPFDTESADMLNELGMPLFKIASCMIPDSRLLAHIARFNKPIILSTGGAEYEEIRDAVDVIYSQGNYLLVIMACTLSYPTETKDAELLRIKKLCALFPEAIIGYSDHTEPDAYGYTIACREFRG